MKCRLVNENFKSNYVDQLLNSRGIESPSAYYEPGPEYLQDPRDLENVERGANLLADVIALGEKILLITDCDNDGFTSATIMYNYLKDLAPELEIDYLLHEGKAHGLQDHIDNLMAQGEYYGLIICPDSSSNDYEYHERLKEINTPVLILDHHITDEKISENAIVINNQLSPNYKNKELTGAGVVYQFCRYLDTKLGKSYADKYMDLAAWGVNTIAPLYLFH